MIDSILFSILIFFAVMNLPQSAGVPLLLLHTRHYRTMDFGKPVEGRKVIVLITTVGKAFDVVQQIIADLKRKNLPIRIMVLIEEYDRNPYDCEKIIVPSDYRTPNNSLNKHRALHYYSEWLRQNGYGKETYTIHIDDDNMLDDRFIRNVFAMTYPAGLGTIRLRAYSRHLLNIVAEFQRVTDYDAFVSFFCIHKRPVGVNGEGLTIRADVEEKLGWDFGPIAAEDLLMGQNIVAHGYEFGYIPGWVYLAPALKSIDFYKQRRRWIWHFFVSAKQVWHLNPIPVIYFTYLYAFGWLPLAGLGIWALIIFLHYSAPPVLLALLTYELFFGFFTTQYGAFQQKHRVWNVAAILLQFPETVYMYGVFFYFLFTYRELKQKLQDDTIEKA